MRTTPDAREPPYIKSKKTMTRIMQQITDRLAWRRILRLSAAATAENVEGRALQIFEALSRVDEATVALDVEGWATRMSEEAERYEARKEVLQVQVALAKLPPAQKQLVDLFARGVKYMAIAESLGMKKEDTLRELCAALVTLQDAVASAEMETTSPISTL